jgi:hypothetical protein
MEIVTLMYLDVGREKNEAKEVNKFVTTLLNWRGHIKKINK